MWVALGSWQRRRCCWAFQPRARWSRTLASQEDARAFPGSLIVVSCGQTVAEMFHGDLRSPGEAALAFSSEPLLTPRITGQVRIAEFWGPWRHPLEVPQDGRKGAGKAGAGRCGPLPHPLRGPLAVRALSSLSHVLLLLAVLDGTVPSRACWPTFSPSGTFPVCVSAGWCCCSILGVILLAFPSAPSHLVSCLQARQ